MTLEDIGDGVDALLCITNLTSCCRGTDGLNVLGQWFFPNGTGVFSYNISSDLYRDRGQMVVRMKRRRGGVDGIYYCAIHGSLDVNQTIYIGVYNISTGE